MRKTIPAISLLILMMLAACRADETAEPTLASTDIPPIVTEDVEVTPSLAAETDTDVTPTICPQATPEWLRVHPVTSPTSELIQTIYVSINNGESVTVTSPAGTFEGREEVGTLEETEFYYNYVVEVALVPASEQELTVMTRIKSIEQGGCPYGGYPLTTKVDINFDPLVIVQAP